MNDAPERAGQVVSKGRYAVNVGRKTLLCCLGVAVFVVGLANLLGVGVTVIPAMLHASIADRLMLIGVLVMTGAGAVFLLYLGALAVGEAKQTRTGVPFTRANTSDLPSPDSLVRASEEPAQAQEVLLRAAAQEAAAPVEQLVRPSEAQRKN